MKRAEMVVKAGVVCVFFAFFCTVSGTGIFVRDGECPAPLPNQKWLNNAAYPFTALFNGLGVADEQSQVFSVRSGKLEPSDDKSGIGAIELPGGQSRWAWLKEGTSATLAVRRGRFGLWEYDDTPLRALADKQGIH